MNNFIVIFIKNNLFLSIICLTLILVYVIFEILMYFYAMKTKFKINCAQLISLLNHNNAMIIDIRTTPEYLAGHIVNAVNLPFDDFTIDNKVISSNSHRVLIIVDAYGKNANALVTKLRNAKISEVWYLNGGMLEWKTSNMPVIIDSRSAVPIQKKINSTDTDILVYSMENCPYCIGAKNLLKNNNYSYREISIKDVDTPEYREMLNLSKGAKTFPQIFINKNHIGGFQELKHLNDSGELSKIIK